MKPVGKKGVFRTLIPDCRHHLRTDIRKLTLVEWGRGVHHCQEAPAADPLPVRNVFFVSFTYVCPEPVLGNRHFSPGKDVSHL